MAGGAAAGSKARYDALLHANVSRLKVLMTFWTVYLMLTVPFTPMQVLYHILVTLL